MYTYLFKTVKMERSILNDSYYRMPDYTTDPAWNRGESAAPPVYRTAKTNSYLIDMDRDNIEMVRYIANTLIQAEKTLFPYDKFLYVLVYALQLGETVNNETPMTLLLDLKVDTKSPYDNVYYPLNPSHYEGLPKGWTWKGGNGMRCTYRGSGRYEPTFVKDAPRYFTQTFAGWVTVGANKLPTNDDFIGLDVVFGTLEGKAVKHVYMGAASKSNYRILAQGNILFHQKGDLFHGAFDNYKKAMQLIWPIMSDKKFDKDGVLVEGEKVAQSPVPNLITEFKAQRRNSYTKQGDSEVFRARLLEMMSRYIQVWCRMINDIQYWNHNLNYDVWAYVRSKEVYLRAERMLRLISAYFPSELVFAPGDNDSRIGTIDSERTLILGNRADEVAECWDRLVLMVDWMRRNYVEYKKSEKIPNYVLHHDDDRFPNWEYVGEGYATIYTAGYDEAYYQRWEADIRKNIDKNTDGYYPSQSGVFPAGTNKTGPTKRIEFGRYSQWPYVTPGAYCRWWFDCYKVTILGRDTYHFEMPYSDYNQWLETTSEVAADIEKVYLSYQFNSMNFIELMAHMFTILDSKPAQKKRAAGPLPGEIIRTEQQQLNAKRKYPKSLGEPRDTRPDGELKEIPLPTVPLPTFAPLQIDARAIIKRCQRDVSQKDWDETEELDQEREAQLDEQKRREFGEQQREIEKRKLKASQKPRFAWRNEIDALSPTQVLNEKISLYNEIAENLETTLDVADAVLDGVEALAFLMAPEATPLLAGEHMTRKAGKAVGKKVVRKLVEVGADVELPELPEFDEPELEPEIYKPDGEPDDPEMPRAREHHRYDPPRTDDSPEFTGDEEEPREWKLCTPESDCTGSLLERFIPDPNNGVDKEVVWAYEPRGDRTLVQQGLRFLDEVYDFARCCGNIPERNPQERYRCVRAKPRLPRA